MDRKELLRALTIAARVAPAHGPKAALRCARLEVDNGKMVIRATDLEITTRTELSMEQDTPDFFTRLVNAKDARNLVKALPSKDVDVRSSEKGTEIGSAFLPGTDSECFPGKPEPMVPLATFTLLAADLRRMIEHVEYAATHEATRYAMNGIMFELIAGRLRLVGTNGHCLAITERDVVAPDFKALVPAYALKILKTSMGKKGDVRVDVGEDVVRFTFGETSMSIRTLLQNFPDVDKVIPNDLPARVEVNRQQLITALRLVLVHVEEDRPSALFGLVPDGLVVRTESADGGKGSAKVDGFVSGEGSVMLNPLYLLQALEASDAERVTLELSPKHAPTKWDLGFTYVLMPITKN